MKYVYFVEHASLKGTFAGQFWGGNHDYYSLKSLLRMLNQKSPNYHFIFDAAKIRALQQSETYEFKYIERGEHFSNYRVTKIEIQN